MEYVENIQRPNPIHDTYERYLESLAVFVGWLLDHGYDVKLLVGDAEVDTFVIDDLRAVLRERLRVERRRACHGWFDRLRPRVPLAAQQRPTSWSQPGSTTS